MAYVDRASNKRRTATAITVAAIQAGMIYAVATGLAVKFIAPADEKRVEGEQIPITPMSPPTEEPEAPIRDPRIIDDPMPRPSAAPSDAAPAGSTVAEGGAGSHVDVGTGGGDGVLVIEPPKPPPPTFTPRAAKPRNAPGGWATPRDYPTSDLRAGHQGVTGFRLSIGADGKVRGCEIIASSGFPGLDRATCDKVALRARFEPAVDGYGNTVAGSYSGRIRWQIPE